MTDYPKDCRSCPVWSKSLFVGFNPELIVWLAEKKKRRTYIKNDELFNQGSDVTGIYCHLHGLVKVVQKDDKGSVRFSRLVLPGDTSGHRSLFIESRYKGTADVISDSLLACFIPKAEILHLLSYNASFARNLVVKISNELNRSEQEHISVKENTVRARLAQLLYKLSDEYSEKIDENKCLIKSEITKKDIASLLAVANETVIRLMSEMKSEQLIGYQGKKIVVNQVAKMKDIAKF